MPAKSSLQQFFKGFDRYSKNVTLTYKQQNKFSTSCGGIAAIITFCIFTAWLTMEFIQVYVPPATFSTSTQDQETMLGDGSFPIYSIKQRELFTSYSLTSEDPAIMANASRIVTGMWIQHNYRDVDQYYLGKDCEEVFNDTQSESFQNQIRGQQCADMAGNSTQLQTVTYQDRAFEGQSYIFVLDICSNLQALSGADCQGTPEQQYELLKNINLQMKIQTQFFRPDEPEKMTSFFKTFQINLSSHLANQQMYYVERHNVNFKNSYIYNSALMGGQEFTFYKLHYAFGGNVRYGEAISGWETYEPRDAPYSFTFIQSQTEQYKEYRRGDLARSFMAFGSYLGLVTTCTVAALATFQSFSIENSMIKKLYSTDTHSQESPNNQRQRSNEILDKGQSKNKLKRLDDAIQNRSIFSYGFSRLWLLRHFGRPACLCCRVKEKREDFLYRTAKEKLYREIDLLEIVKQMRVSMFASDVVLKPQQRLLVSFFDEYKLGDGAATKDAPTEKKQINSKQNELNRSMRPDHMENILEGNKLVGCIAEAVKEMNIEESVASDQDLQDMPPDAIIEKFETKRAEDIDKEVYNRILCSDSSDDSQQRQKRQQPLSSNRGKLASSRVTSADMDDFISNLRFEQRRNKNFSLTAPHEFQSSGLSNNQQLDDFAIQTPAQQRRANDDNQV